MKDYKEYYCRTKDGIKQILKYEKRPQYENCHCIYFVDNDYGLLFTDEEFEKLKPSETLINLIEAGDYVNGRKVFQVGYNFQDEFVLKMSNSNYEDFIYEKDIKSVVTKEQFESMEYKVK